MPACNRTDSRIQLQKCPDLLENWNHIEIEAYAQSLRKKTEVIWMNFEISEEYGQMSFL